MDEITDLALAAGAGDRDAFTELIRRTQADIWRFCAHLYGPGDADDLTQEVYVRAFGALPRFRGDASARSWLLTIARRTCADQVRVAQRRRRLDGQLRDRARHSGREAVDDRAGAHGLEDLVAALPEDYRVAFTLTQVVGLSYAETASVCGCPVGTVRSRVARAREAIITGVAEAEADEGTAEA